MAATEKPLSSNNCRTPERKSRQTLSMAQSPSTSQCQGAHGGSPAVALVVRTRCTPPTLPSADGPGLLFTDFADFSAMMIVQNRAQRATDCTRGYSTAPKPIFTRPRSLSLVRSELDQLKKPGRSRCQGGGKSMGDLIKLLAFMRRLAKDVPKSQLMMAAVIFAGVLSGLANTGMIAVINSAFTKGN